MKHLNNAQLHQNLSFAQFKGDLAQVEKIKKELRARHRKHLAICRVSYKLAGGANANR